MQSYRSSACALVVGDALHTLPNPFTHFYFLTKHQIDGDRTSIRHSNWACPDFRHHSVQLSSERLADEGGSRLAQLIIGVRIALRETIILAERHAQEKVYADLRAIADGENTRN